MEESISQRENTRVKGIVKLLIKNAQSYGTCIRISRLIGKYKLERYELNGLEEELYYKKERWLDPSAPFNKEYNQN